MVKGDVFLNFILMVVMGVVRNASALIVFLAFMFPFQAYPSVHGSWTCMLTLSEDYESLTTFADLQVALRPLVSLDYPAGGYAVVVPAGHDDHSNISRIMLVEGQDYNFTCMAERVFPRPVFYWTVDYKYSSQIVPVHGHPVITMSPSSYFFTSYHTITLSTSLMLNTTLLSCHVTQYHTRTGKTMGRTNMSVRLLVDPRQKAAIPAPEKNDMSLAVIVVVGMFLIGLISKFG